jgi:hypothetical protein
MCSKQNLAMVVCFVCAGKEASDGRESENQRRKRRLIHGKY